jgi:hypothetical protein
MPFDVTSVPQKEIQVWLIMPSCYVFAAEQVSANPFPTTGSDNPSLSQQGTLDPNEPATAAAAKAEPGTLSAGGVAGVVIACLVVAAVMGVVVARGLAKNRGKDTDKSAQLAYSNELVEADLDLDGGAFAGARPVKGAAALEVRDTSFRSPTVVVDAPLCDPWRILVTVIGHTRVELSTILRPSESPQPPYISCVLLVSALSN